MKTKGSDRLRPRRRALPWLAATAVLFSLMTPLRGATLDEGLIAYYPFSGNANDASPNGNNGTVVGAQPTSDRNGAANQAYLFDGVNDSINIGSQVKPNFPLTVTAWIYPTSADIGTHAIFRSGSFDGSGSFSGVLLSFSGRGFLYTYIGSGPYSNPANWRSWAMSNWIIPANTWTHIAVVWIATDTMRFYVNGVLQPAHYDGVGTGLTIVNTSSAGAIGIRDDVGDPSPFMGKLDEIRVYSRELAPDEVTTLAIEPPSVAIQPSSVATNAGSSVVLTANATGAPTLMYQWQFQGTNINGANTNTLTFTNLKTTDSGTYRVVVTNPVGTNSADATLTVTVQAQAISNMPRLFTNGVPFMVTISVTPPAATSFYGVQDQPPTGWLASQISNGGNYSGGKVQWIVPDGLSHNFSYRVTPPAGAAGTNYFVGTVSFNGSGNVPVTGIRYCYNELINLSVGTLNLFGSEYAKLTLNGKAGVSYHILVADGMDIPPLWRTNGTITLSGTSEDWLDAEPMGNTSRFYRAKVAP